MWFTQEKNFPFLPGIQEHLKKLIWCFSWRYKAVLQTQHKILSVWRSHEQIKMSSELHRLRSERSSCRFCAPLWNEWDVIAKMKMSHRQHGCSTTAKNIKQFCSRQEKNAPKPQLQRDHHAVFRSHRRHEHHPEGDYSSWKYWPELASAFVLVHMSNEPNHCKHSPP